MIHKNNSNFSSITTINSSWSIKNGNTMLKSQTTSRSYLHFSTFRNSYLNTSMNKLPSMRFDCFCYRCTHIHTSITWMCILRQFNSFINLFNRKHRGHAWIIQIYSRKHILKQLSKIWKFSISHHLIKLFISFFVNLVNIFFS